MTTEQLTDVTLHNGLWHYTRAEELLEVARDQLTHMMAALHEEDEDQSVFDAAEDIRAIQMAGVIVDLHTRLGAAHAELAGVHAAVANVRKSGALPDLPGSWSGLPR